MLPTYLHIAGSDVFLLRILEVFLRQMWDDKLVACKGACET